MKNIERGNCLITTAARSCLANRGRLCLVTKTGSHDSASLDALVISRLQLRLWQKMGQPSGASLIGK